jgi:single-stranded DNA-binding protein
MDFIDAVFFIKILYKNCKKQVHKGYPLAGPCICN